MGEVLTVRRREEGKQLEEEEEEGKRRNLREVEMEMGGLLCLADLLGELSPSARGCNKQKDLGLGSHKEASLAQAAPPPGRPASGKAGR